MPDQELRDRILEFAKKQAGTFDKYPYAFGYVFAMLNDEQAATIDRWISKEGF